MIAATAIGVDSGRDGARVAELDFDVAIIDEASQAHLMDLVVPLSRARSVVLVGDHRQLPPYLDEDLRERCAAADIEPRLARDERLRVPVGPRARDAPRATGRPVPHAVRHRRLPWQRLLRAATWRRALRNRRMPTGERAVRGRRLCSSTPRMIRSALETALPQGFLNRCEAELCAQLWRRAAGGSLAGRDRAVRGAGRRAFVSRWPGRAGCRRATRGSIDNVATVDSFQGQERDVVIVSLTRSNRDGAVGFVSDLNRLNVTLSRAREQLVIVGDLSTLDAAPSSGAGAGRGLRREAFARFIGELVEHLQTQGEVMSSGVLRARLADG